MSELARAAQNYLDTRRALGFRLRGEGQLLAQFVAFMDKAGLSVITTDAALAWATGPVDVDPYWWGSRLAVVRTFASWLVAFDPHTQVPAADLLRYSSQRAEPYPYTDADITALMTAAATIAHPLRAGTYQTLIGLLAVTGMRVGEAIRLDRTDLDAASGALTIRHAKFDKSRELPLHPSTIDALAAYARVRDRTCPHPPTPSLLVSIVGTRLIYKNVHHTWLDLARQAGLRPRSPRCRPRIHDLRHRFAIATLLGWYQGDADIPARLPQLSTYLGHVSPASTYWYLHGAPELLALAGQRLEAHQGGSR
jgi:integrase/recombinase XerD